MRARSLLVTGAGALALAAGPARARAEVAPPLELSASVGSGLDGDAPTMVVAAQVDRRWGDPADDASLAVGLGGRLRWREGAVLTSDWDDGRDALRLVRYVEARARAGTVDLAVALGPLVDLDVGRTIRGYGTGIVDGAVHPGVALGLAWRGGAATVLVDDALRPMVVGAGGTVALGPRWRADASVAVDTGAIEGTAPAMATMAAPAGAVTPRAQVELGATRGLRPGLSAGGAVVLDPTGGQALLADGRATRAFGELTLDARAELRAGRGAGIAAPLGPLTLVERELASPPMMTPGAGVGAALGLRASLPGWGDADAELRRLIGGGLAGRARLLVAAREPVQGAIWIASSPTAHALASELRVRWSPRTLSRLEAIRTYDRRLDGELAPRWQVMAWFGTRASW